MTDWRHHRSARLWLDVATPGDEDDLFAIPGPPGWRGPDVGNVDPEAVRLVLADRELPENLLARVIGSA